MSLLIPPENNFADLREASNSLLKSSKDEDLKRLAGIVGTLLFRCDLLEREVERLGRPGATGTKSPAKKSMPKKKARR
jgi:hypothetical protein